ncbi:hypothetical protein P5673_006483 [Acropora cervicornis]|uniref:Uncharacterized protein n=1 Tax=Acropora cervicornis TaxID=6130 RepID=A0AAD9QW79_ACRCE|nr:hypothetical protein P5673_006483 [Acropora cervicornis]
MTIPLGNFVEISNTLDMRLMGAVMMGASGMGGLMGRRVGGVLHGGMRFGNNRTPSQHFNSML